LAPKRVLQLAHLKEDYMTQQNLQQLFSKSAARPKKGKQDKTRRLIEKIEKADRDFEEAMKIQKTLQEAFDNLSKTKNLSSKKKKALF
jgi:hypothetical protein